MNACPDKETLIHALVDGELDAANTLELEAHLKQCGGCAAELRRLQALRRALTSREAAYTAPARLRETLSASIDAATAGAPTPQRIAPWAVGAVGGALAASLALVALLPAAGPSLQDELVADHVRSTLAGHLTDVATSNQHVVRPWFNGKIDFSPPVTELADLGFPLAGGRLDYVERQVVPALVYRRRLHVINLFIWPEGRAPARRGPGFARRDGYSLEHWKAQGLEFWAVSDIDPGELKAFRRAFQSRAGG